MRRLLRTAVFILGWGILTVGALVFVLGPTWFATPAGQAVPRAVPDGDQEIVWLNAATNAVSWERFIAAVHRLEENGQLDIVDETNAFPSQTTAVPELAVTVAGSKGRLWFRWYKTIADIGTTQWVEALMARKPPPLAIIGGGSSDRARDLARELRDRHAKQPATPLMLITTATADTVDTEDRLGEDLMSIYADRSFRYCFTNRQMAEASVDFIWSRDELRPDADPIYYVHWKDDPYSNDLFERFREVLRGERFRGPKDQQQTIRGWMWELPYSEGDFNQPSFRDSGAAERLMDAYQQHPEQTRPLLILPANPPNGRRFLRALVRIAPTEAGRFVVATGDAIDFNTVYRDRRLAWPIQDLPVALVLFCHRNPVDPDAFEPESRARRHDIPDPMGQTSTGTQDLLLYCDIVESVIEAAFHNGELLSSADDLAAALHKSHAANGRSRFDAAGNQHAGTGEYIVWLQPIRQGDRVKPQATMQIWRLVIDAQDRRSWTLVRRLDIEYLHAPDSTPLRTEP